MSHIEKTARPELKWLLREDGALCLDGYPIRIQRRVKAHSSIFPFELVSDWHNVTRPMLTIAEAKGAAIRLADEIDEMTPRDGGGDYGAH